MIKVFCTRELQEKDYKKALRHGIEIMAEDFIKIIPVLSEKNIKSVFNELNQPHQTLLFTSKNAVDIALKYYLSSIPAAYTSTWEFYSLSGATKEALLSCFEAHQIIGVANHAAALTKVLVDYKDKTSVHFFCGDIRRNTLPDFMSEHHIPFKEWVIYKTESNAHPVRENYQAYLFYSPSAVESFFSVNTIKKEIPCFSIGQTTAKALKEETDNPVYIIEKSNTNCMLKNLFQYFKTEI